MNKTIEYYNENVDKYVSDTVDVEFSDLQNRFLSQVKDGGNILDLGCGSGRDSKAFIERGYKVTAVDGSEEMCKVASEIIGQDVICSFFEEFETDEKFDGIWACSSLLHLKKDALVKVLKKMETYLKEDGCFYMSFKMGDFEGERNGRYFTDMTDESFDEIIGKVDGLEVKEYLITQDVRRGREGEEWLNVWVIKKS